MVEHEQQLWWELNGYVGVQAVGHHCMGANQAPLLEALLSQPEWLHNKLRAYGVASLVSDFRRCCWLSMKGSQRP